MQDTRVSAAAPFRHGAGLRALVLHKHLVWQFTLRNIHLRHRGSFLGITWSLLNPLMMMAVYTFVFGVIFNGRYGAVPGETRMDYALGIFLSLTFFNLISEVIATAPGIITGQPNLVKKVVFPLEILPVAAVGASLYHFTISLSLVLVGVLTLGHGLTWSAALLPILLLPMVLIALGLAWLLSAVGVFLRDIAQVTGVLTLVLMYASAIFYPMSKVPPEILCYLRWNPIAALIEQTRFAVLWNLPVDWSAVAWAYVFAVALFVCGHVCFQTMKRAFADVI